MSNCLDIKINNKICELNDVKVKLKLASTNWNIPDSISYSIELSIEEMVSNIIYYGFSDNQNHEIKIKLEKSKDQLRVVIDDEGTRFNPIDYEIQKDPFLDQISLGGLGILLTKELMDNIDYKRIGNTNKLTMIKKLK